MKKIGLVSLISIITCVLFTTIVYSAETYYQKDGLFEIDIPSEFPVQEELGKITIGDLKKDKFGLSIKFSPSSIKPGETPKEVLKRIHDIYCNTVKLAGMTKIISNDEIKIKGIDAYQLEERFTSNTGEITYLTRINTINKNYFFSIALYWQTEREKKKLEEILDTLRFQ